MAASKENERTEDFSAYSLVERSAMNSAARSDAEKPSPEDDKPISAFPSPSGRLSRSTCKWLGSALLLGILVYGAFAFNVTSTDPETNFLRDGFGRRLRETPSIVRAVFGKERVWAGWSWFAVDALIMVSGLIAGAMLFNRGDEKPGARSQPMQ